MTTTTAPMPIQLPRLILDVREVHVDFHNHRIEDASDAALVDSLAASILQNGQQQPGLVCLCPPGMAKGAEKYRLVFGFRRHQACTKAGVGFQADFIDRVLSEAEILSLRATENLDRDNLNPVEECLAVSKLADTLDEGGPLEPAEIHQEIANRLGRTPEWVRDRLYVHRLPKSVKDKVAAGTIPLAYARELAKVADPARCYQLSEDILSYRDGSGEPRRVERSLGWLRNRVNGERFSLRIVPWDVASPLAGEPACLNCPFNTANDMALFEHDSKASRPEVLTPKGLDVADERRLGVCTKKHCHEKKAAAASKLIQVGVEKVRAAAKKNKELGLGAAALQEAGLMPKGVKTSSFARAVANQIRPGEKAEKPSKTSKPSGDSKLTPEEAMKADAASKHDAATGEWTQEILNAVGKAAAENRVLAAALTLVTESLEWSLLDRGGKEMRKVLKAGGLTKAIAKIRPGMKLSEVGEVAESLTYEEVMGWENAYPMHDEQRGVIEAIGEAFGIKLKRPVLADFMPKGKPAEADSKPTAKKPAAKKAKKKGA